MTGAVAPVEVAEGVWLVVNRTFPSNTWLCRLPQGGCLVVDPGLDEEALREALRLVALTPRAVLSTHGHFDHVAGAAWLQRSYGAPLHLHEADLPVLKRANFLMMVCKVEGRIELPEVDVLVGRRTDFQVDGVTVRFRPTPGHTPGSCVIDVRGVLFSGDTLYRRAMGLVRLPGESRPQLRESLQALWADVPDETLLCPGHGAHGLMSDVRVDNQQVRDFLAAGAEGVL